MADHNGLPPKKRRESIGPRRAAEVLGVSRSTIYRMIHEGDIPAYRVRAAIRITVANLIAFRRKNRLPKLHPRIAARLAATAATTASYEPVDK